jgi:hypothetical protein
MSLYEQRHAAAALLASLRALGEEDEEVLATAVEGETELAEAVASAVAEAALAEGQADAVQALIGSLVRRRERLQARSERIRGQIADTLAGLGMRRLSTPAGTVSLAPSPPAVIITDREGLPTAFWREKVLREPDKAAIRKALQDGQDVYGATLSNQPTTLRIRT